MITVNRGTIYYVVESPEKAIMPLKHRLEIFYGWRKKRNG